VNASAMPASAALLRTQLLAAVEEWWGTGHDLDALGDPLMAVAEPFLAEIAKLTAKISDYENAINWNTTCFSCAAVLDSSIREHERAEKAEAENARLKTEIAEKDGLLILAKEGAFKS
jgi:hypothetical protein